MKTKTRRLTFDDVGQILRVTIRGIRQKCQVNVRSIGDCGQWCRLQSIDCTDHAFCCGQTSRFKITDVAVELPAQDVDGGAGKLARLALILLAAGLAGCGHIDLPDLPDLPDWPDVPAVTNLPPIVNPPVDPKPGACKCDLSRSLVASPEAIYNAVHGKDALSKAGNREECPVRFAGKDIRCRVVGQKGRPQIASWCADGYRLGAQKNQVDCSCFSKAICGKAYQFHFAGWARSGKEPTNTTSPLVYSGTTFAFWEMREAGP
jgi:hypothetical protein